MHKITGKRLEFKKGALLRKESKQNGKKGMIGCCNDQKVLLKGMLLELINLFVHPNEREL